MISTIIPCFNAVQTLERAVRSCLIQAEISEVIVVDDASTDGSLELARQLSQRHPKIISLQMPCNSGPAAARNFGVLHSASQLVPFLDADDEYTEGGLTLGYLALMEHSQLSAIKLPCEFVGCPDKYVKHASFKEACRTLENTFAGNLMIRREVLFALGLFPQAAVYRQHGGEDGVLMLALSRGFQIGVVEQEWPSVKVHFHAQSHSQLYFERCIEQMDNPLFKDDRDEVWHHSMSDVQVITEQLKRLGVNINSPVNGFIPIWKR